ncbi:MAG: hypothetical protein HRU15_12070 [Planctomycetes bacterium]|nr:hypothetical protein [Planctomycetota bacterium]
MFKSLSVLCILCISLSLSPLYAQSSSWKALPAETLLSFHIPDGTAAVEALRPTKLHAFFADSEKWQKLKDFIAKKGDADFDIFMEKLAEFELSLSDFPKFLHGESGGALLATENQGLSTEPLMTGLFWLNPGTKLADTLMAVCNVASQEAQGRGELKRTDFDLGEYAVIELADINDDFFVFIHRHGDTLLFACSDKNALQVSKEHFARFITAHDAGGAVQGFAHIVMSTPGVEESLPAGASLGDFFVNPQVLLQLAPQDQIAMPGMTVSQVIDALGVNDIQALAMRLSIDGNTMKQSFFVSALQPLRGILRLAAQPEFAAVPEPWVPLTALSYSHIGIDLLSIFEIGKELTLVFAGQNAQGQIMMAEQMPMMYFGVDLNTLLGCFGNKVSIIDYGEKAPQKA